MLLVLADDRFGLTAPTSDGLGNNPQQQHENHAESNSIGGKLAFHRAVERCPSRDDDEVRSHVSLTLPFV
jgi:hypothetical protein